MLPNPEAVSPSRFFNRTVKVHYNLHRCPRKAPQGWSGGGWPPEGETCWVVSVKQAGGWKVGGYVSSLLLADCEFKVSAAGVDRIRNEGVRSVVAWIVGKAIDPNGRDVKAQVANRRSWVGVSFNPFDSYSFYAVSDGRSVKTAPLVYLSGRRAVAKLTTRNPELDAEGELEAMAAAYGGSMEY